MALPQYMTIQIPLSVSGLPLIKPLQYLPHLLKEFKQQTPTENTITEPLDHLSEAQKTAYVNYMVKIYINFHKQVNRTIYQTKTLYEILGDDTIPFNYLSPGDGKFLNNYIQTNLDRDFPKDSIKTILNTNIFDLEGQDTNILIVDLESINYITKDNIIGSTIQHLADREIKFNNPNNFTYSDTSVPKENGHVVIDSFRKSVYLILKYAINTGFTNIFITCKTVDNKNIFENQLKEIIETGELTYDISPNNINSRDYIFRQKINCSDISEKLKSNKLRCILLKCDIPNINSDRSKVEIHRLKGGDDATIILLVDLLREIRTNNSKNIKEIKILSNDEKMLEEYRADFEYILPFDIDIIKYTPVLTSTNEFDLSNESLGTFVFNFSTSQIISESTLDDANFKNEHVIKLDTNFYQNYYFDPSNRISQKNWFLRTNEVDTNGKKIIHTFIGYPGIGTFDLPYSDEKGNVLLDDKGNPFISKNQIVRWNKGSKEKIFVPFGLLQPDGKMQDYAKKQNRAGKSVYEPLKKDGNLLTDKNGNIKTIPIQASRYYEKYLKYKEKYLALKKLLNN